MNNIRPPAIWADVPDPDVIRVDDVYYMSSTTMYFTPGVPIMKSRDLIRWEIIGYVYDILDDGDACALKNGSSAYGKGSWASSLRYNKGVFYLSVASFTTGKTYIFTTADIESGHWKRHTFEEVYHDSSLLFDDDGRVYLVYGGGTIRIIELKPDASAVLPGGLNKIIIEKANAGGDGGLPAEGAHFYKINGMYYLFLIAWPDSGTKRRIELCYRSGSIEGPYEGKVVFDDDIGYNNAGVAQGGIFDTPDGDRYAMLFQDHGAVGRVPVLLKLTWEKGWPLLSYDTGKNRYEENNRFICVSDEFDYTDNKLALAWQFNHNPVNSLWSVTERSGFLRLKSGSICKDITQAHNTLTQRAFGPVCSGTACLEISGMKEGDAAGLAALQELYGFIAVEAAPDGKYIITENTTAGTVSRRVRIDCDRVYFRIDFDFDGGDIANFYYSFDEKDWQLTGEPLRMEYRLSHFTGYRFALFYYSTKQTGGYVDFDYFRVSEMINSY